MLRPVLDQISKLWARVDLMPVVRWGTVTSGDPLRVMLDGSTEVLPFAPQTTVQGLVTGDRVVCVEQHRRVIIVARAGSQRGAGVIPASVAVDTGSASVAPDGTVTFTDVTSISFNGIFDGTGIDTYDLFLRAMVEDGEAISTRFREAGVDYTTDYNMVGQVVYANGGPVREHVFGQTFANSWGNGNIAGRGTFHTPRSPLGAYLETTGTYAAVADRFIKQHFGEHGGPADGLTLFSPSLFSGTFKAVKL